MENKPPKTESKLRYLIGVSFVIIVLWGLNLWLLLPLTDRGSYGDMFGAVNALISGFAFVMLIYTAWMQREELALQREELVATREELKGQKEQLEQQTKTFELQRFENSFFSLLKAQSDIVNAMEVIDTNSRNIKSRGCFYVWYQKFYKFYTDSKHIGFGQETNDINNAMTVYLNVYKKNQNELGHYFRHLYHVIKFINESSIPDKEKKRYASLVRAQLSAYEHVFLFFNGLSIYGIEKFKPLIEIYQLLENMPKDLVLNKNYLKLYSPSAYGDDVEKAV
jgi:hypothetical protein